MTTDTGGAAFPVPNDANVNGQEGQTLLDHFAGLAMQGLVVNAKDNIYATGIATLSYEVASSMIAEKRRREANG